MNYMRRIEATYRTKNLTTQIFIFIVLRGSFHNSRIIRWREGKRSTHGHVPEKYYQKQSIEYNFLFPVNMSLILGMIKMVALYSLVTKD